MKQEDPFVRDIKAALSARPARGRERERERVTVWRWLRGAWRRVVTAEA